MCKYCQLSTCKNKTIVTSLLETVGPGASTNPRFQIKHQLGHFIGGKGTAMSISTRERPLSEGRMSRGRTNKGHGEERKEG
jgi:hypothetical protein